MIDVCRHSEKTWYQANWFTININNVQALWNRICENQQIDVSDLDASICSKAANYIKDFPSKEFASQQHSAVELKKSEELETEILDCDPEPVCQTEIVNYTQEGEQTQISHFVEDIELVNSTGVTVHHENNFFAAPVVSKFHDEDSGDDDYAEPQEKSVQPSSQEVQEVLQQLREIPCTPQFRLNAQIQRTVRQCWENVPGAIAYLKEAIRTWKGIKSPEAVFVAACKEGRKPEAQQAQGKRI